MEVREGGEDNNPEDQNPLIHFDGDAKPMPDGLEPKTRRPRTRPMSPMTRMVRIQVVGPMPLRIDANKDGVSNQKDFQTNEKKVAPRRMPLSRGFQNP